MKSIIPSLILAAAAALAARLLGAPWEAAAVVLIVAIGAVLLQTVLAEAPAPPVPPEPELDSELGPLLDAVSDPLVVIASGRIVAANHAANTLLGAGLIGQDIRLLLRHPAASELLRRDATEAATATLLGLGGAERQWEMRVSGLSAGRRLIQFVDYSAIRAAERMRVDFVANASHELRTPIAAIGGFAETLADDAAGNDPATRARFLGIITRETRRMQRLVEDLLSLSRIEADRHRAPEAHVDIAIVAAEAATAAATLAGERGSDLILEMNGEAIVEGDHAQLFQLVHNLVSNAFKYGRASTPVRLAVAAADGAVLLIVADQGDGIAAEHLPRLTERFYRVDPGRSRAQGGTGLGLAIVKHIVERHRGRLDIASEPGVGTTITVSLPLS